MDIGTGLDGEKVFEEFGGGSAIWDLPRGPLDEFHQSRTHRGFVKLASKDFGNGRAALDEFGGGPSTDSGQSCRESPWVGQEPHRVEIGSQNRKGRLGAVAEVDVLGHCRGLVRDYRSPAHLSFDDWHAKAL